MGFAGGRRGQRRWPRDRPRDVLSPTGDPGLLGCLGEARQSQEHSVRTPPVLSALSRPDLTMRRNGDVLYFGLSMGVLLSIYEVC